MATIAPPRRDVDEKFDDDSDYDETDRQASAIGTSDDYCHRFLDSRPPYRQTRCGMTVSPPLRFSETHPDTDCPNGWPTCPRCIAAEDE